MWPMMICNLSFDHISPALLICPSCFMTSVMMLKMHLEADMIDGSFEWSTQPKSKLA